MTIENLPVLAILPDWADGILETLTWNTSLLAATRSGVNGTAAEQRRKLRLSPRKQLDIDLQLIGQERTMFDLLLHNAGNSFLYCPLWYQVDSLAEPLASGSTYLDMGVAGSEYAPIAADGGFSSGFAIFLGGDAFTYEVVEAAHSFGDAHRADGLYFSATTKSWSRGTRVLPCRKMQLTQQPQFTRKTSAVSLCSLQLQCEPPNDWVSTGQDGFDTYKGRPVLLDAPNEADDMPGTFDRTSNTLDNDTGMWVITDTGGRGFGTQTHTWMLIGRLAHAAMRDKLYALQGRFQGIYVPTFADDMELARPFTSGQTNMTIKRIGYTDLGFPVEGRDEIIFFMNDGARLYATITASANDGLFEIIGFDAAPGRDVHPEDVARISFLQYSRLDQDAVEISHETDTFGTATVSAIFRAISYDREETTWVPPPLTNNAMTSASCGSPVSATYYRTLRDTIFDPDKADDYNVFGFDAPGDTVIPTRPGVTEDMVSGVETVSPGVVRGVMNAGTPGFGEFMTSTCTIEAGETQLYVIRGGAFTLDYDTHHSPDVVGLVAGSQVKVGITIQRGGDYVPTGYSSQGNDALFYLELEVHARYFPPTAFGAIPAHVDYHTDLTYTIDGSFEIVSDIDGVALTPPPSNPVELAYHVHLESDGHGMISWVITNQDDVVVANVDPYYVPELDGVSKLMLSTTVILTDEVGTEPVPETWPDSPPLAKPTSGWLDGITVVPELT